MGKNAQADALNEQGEVIKLRFGLRNHKAAIQGDGY
jgi:hypothetical protein